ncbi:cyclic peptide export ABC transporter [Stigmatella sp. ncwal1]|uniref:Cyclic peptide export ABC transporter n=1 Tax=Stigmatella ashevillensis TaxID=2995309 RepID=A0ABT5DED0_9BACT|nr:cyclic peptide export ABC transporter [Stigmatella ashevillena]MDC0710672.1 cyclic peptide export ABC transporter [Stigmatella ashevillena]
MSLIAFLLRRAPAGVLLSALAGLASGLMTAGLLALVGRWAARPEPGGLALEVFFALCGAMFLTKVGSEQLFIRSSLKAVFELRMQLGRHVLAAPLRQLEEVGPARLLSALTEDVTLIAQALPFVSSLVVNLVLVAACLLILGMLSLPLLMALSLVLALGTVTYRALASEGVRRFEVAHRSQGILHEHLRALVAGSKQLKLHAGRREAFLQGRFGDNARALRDQLWAAIRLFVAGGQWGSLLFLGGIGLVLFVAPQAGWVEPPVRAAATVTLLYLMLPLGELLLAVHQLSRASVALDSLERLGLSPAPSAGAPPPPVPGASWRRLELRGVSHGYVQGGERTFVLGPIDFTLHPGEVVFIAGGNGSGKSTLLKLLTGLYPPERGEIVLDGRIITDADLEWYQQHFSAVFSDHHLFDGLYGISGPSWEAEARTQMARLGLEGEVRLHGRHFSTTQLSQGQRKRLALLVSLLEDKPLAVYDEPAAELAPGFKDFFYRQLVPELKARGKGVLIVTHDDRYFAHADRVLTLENGRFREASIASPARQ